MRHSWPILVHESLHVTVTFTRSSAGQADQETLNLRLQVQNNSQVCTVLLLPLRLPVDLSGSRPARGIYNFVLVVLVYLISLHETVLTDKNYHNSGQGHF